MKQIIKRITTSLWTYRILRWALALVFIYAGASKLADPKGFATVIDAYCFFPSGYAWPAAILICIMEIAAGILLAFNITGGLAGITGMLMMFMLVLGYGIYLGLDVDCGCFNSGDPGKPPLGNLLHAFYRDMAFLGIAIYLYIWRFLNTNQFKFKTLY